MAGQRALDHLRWCRLGVVRLRQKPFEQRNIVLELLLKPGLSTTPKEQSKALRCAGQPWSHLAAVVIKVPARRDERAGDVDNFGRALPSGGMSM